MFRRLQGSVDEKVELRLSIYGRKSSEWSKIVYFIVYFCCRFVGVFRDELSNWIVSNQLYSGAIESSLYHVHIYVMFISLSVCLYVFLFCSFISMFLNFTSVFVLVCIWSVCVDL